MARVCVDACFLIGLYDRNDQQHSTAIRQFDALFGENSPRHILVVPWPILYECCGTQQAKSNSKTSLFSTFWSYLEQRGQLIRLDDLQYREGPLKEQLRMPSRSLSLADRVIRSMNLDTRSLFDYFLTYNSGDFLDACKIRGIPLLNEKSEPGSYGL